MTTTEPASLEEPTLLERTAWETYERLLAEHAQRSSPRFTYDRGALEIMTPTVHHELVDRAIEKIMSCVELATGINILSLGSTTFRRRDLNRGFEPDSCYYIKNESLVRRKRVIDLTRDPPPDIVVEIEETRSAIPKLPVLEAFRVPEVWLYSGDGLTILVLEATGYVSVPKSLALPMVSADDLSRLLQEHEAHAPAEWLRAVREWAEGLTGWSKT